MKEQESGGVFRRRIRLTNANSRMVIAGVEDDFHAFGLRLHHNGETVESCSGTAVRYPLDICREATEQLPQLKGITLSPDCRHLGSVLDPRQHCTHLFDLAGLAIAQASRSEAVRQYDVIIPDTPDERTTLQLLRNGHKVLSITLEGSVIKAPKIYSGISIAHGFSVWAQTHIPDLDEREAALVAARGRFVFLGRKNRDQIMRTKTAWRHVPVGSCYSYQAHRIDAARRMEGSVQDFSKKDDSLLAFMSVVDGDKS